MRFARPLRLPLQTGATSLTTVLFTFILIPFYWGIWPVLVIYLMGRDAARRRASDIVLSADGFEIHGGPQNGLFRPWKGLVVNGTYVAETDETYYKSGDDPTVYIQQLVLDEIEVARGGAADEVASFHAIADLCVAATRGTTDESARAPATNVPLCPSCGAPLVPVDAETARCAYCAAEISVAAEVREAAREATEIDRTRERASAAVRRALRGGRARTVNYLVLACGLSGHAAAPFALWAMLNHQLSLAFVPVAVPFVLTGAARIAISRRIAARGLAFGCAAVAPTDPSHPARCRRCSGPLPVREESSTLVTCAYCGAVNVLGIEFSGTAQSNVDWSDLDQVLASHRAATVKAWLIVAAGVAVCTVAMMLSWR